MEVKNKKKKMLVTTTNNDRDGVASSTASQPASYIPSLPGSIVMSSNSPMVLYEYVKEILIDDPFTGGNTYECRGSSTLARRRPPMLVIASVQCHTSGHSSRKRLKILYVETLDAARLRGWCLDPAWFESF